VLGADPEDLVVEDVLARLESGEHRTFQLK